MSNTHKNSNLNSKETDENYLKEADLPKTNQDNDNRKKNEIH
ncbi:MULTISPECIES: hypothetical protein [unclassified Clostridium]